MQTNESGDSVDDALRALSDPARRGMMYVLSDGNGDRLGYDELVDEMVERGYVEEASRETFEIGLNHRHLPKLEDTGVINYNKEQGYVERVPHEKVDQIVDSLEEIEK